LVSRAILVNRERPEGREPAAALETLDRPVRLEQLVRPDRPVTEEQ
jgi:hypothetical protein